VNALCLNPSHDGQHPEGWKAELAVVVGYMSGRLTHLLTVSHSSSNWALHYMPVWSLYMKVTINSFSRNVPLALPHPAFL